MKNSNLIERLWTDSHEKQTPQRFGRYAAMLIMLLTLGVGQVWADTPPTTKTASNLIIFQSKTPARSAWMWKDSDGGTVRNFTVSSKVGDYYVSTYNNATNKYNKLIAFKTAGTDGSTSWPNLDRISGSSDVVAPSITSGQNWYLKNSSTESATPNPNKQFVHLSVSTSLSPSSSVTTGTAVSVTYTSLSGDLSDNTNNKWNFFYSTDGGTTKTRFSTENKSYPTSGSSAPSFTPSVAGSYKVYAYLSDPWGIEVIVREMSLTVSDPTYTVTYYGNGNTSGSAPSDGSSPYTSGTTVTVLGKGELAKTGYVFAGWNTANDGTGTYYAPGATFSITSNKDLYAVWLDKAVLDGTNVMFYYQGYCDKNCNNRLVESADNILSGSTNLGSGYGYAHTAKSNLTSYYFVSNNPSDWGGNANDGIKTASGGELFIANSSISTTPAKTATTTATPDGTNLRISTTCNSATGVYNSKSLYILYYMDNEIVAVTYSGTPTMFIPASTSARASSISGLADGDYTMKTILTDGLVYYVAETDEFTISSATRTLTYHANYAASGTGSVPSPQTVDLNSSATVAGNTGSLAMDKYTFDGWNTSQYIDGTAYAAGSSMTMDENKDLYAKWTYNVTLNANGGAGGSSSFVGVWNCSTLPAITNPSRTGYNFVEWNTQSDGNGSSVIIGGALQASKYNWTDASGRFQRNPGSENKPLYAKWTAKTYTAEGNLKEASGTSNGKYTATYDATSITINTTPTKTGYHVEGYYTSSDLTTKVASPEGVLVASVDGWTNGTGQWKKDANVSLYIKWTPNTYTVQFHRNGGEGEVVSQEFTYGVAQNLTPNTYTRANYTFAGWALTTSGAVTYTDGAEVSNLATTGTFHLYAKWTEIPYSVTLQNATESSVSAGCETGHSITAASAPFGMGFNHWEVVSGSATFVNANSATTTVKATSDATVKAVYVQNMWVYIQGRFEAYTDKTKQTLVRTGTNSGDKYWNTSSTALKMDYNPATHVYYLHTYKYPSELKQYDNDAKFYISLKTSSSSSGLSDVTEYFANSASSITAADTKIDFSTTSGSNRPYIDNSTSNKYLVLYWNGTKMWYEEESIMAAIDEVDLSVTRVPPTAPITATPTMYVRGVVNKAYCWGVYTDAGCTEGNKVSNIAFTSLGDRKVQFMAPQEQGTYYLKLTVHSTDDCNATIDDEKVVSFTVTTDDMVFFKNVPGWGNVHVYFLGTSDYWDDDLGSGCAGRDNGTAHGMTRIGNSDVYYYDYHGNSNVVFDANGKAYIAFTDNYKPNSNNFSECQAVFRGDFSECAAMFVPENWITHYLNNAAYYNRGYWTNYMSANSGFTFYLWDKTANNAASENTIVSGAELTGTVGNNTYVYEYNFENESYHKNNLPYTYGFKIKGCGGSWYGAEDDMTITKCTDWNLGTDTRKCGLSVNAALPHKFIFTLAGDGHVQVSVEYPVSIGDYRLLYDDETQNPHPSQFIRKRANGKDTVAMYVRPSEIENLKVQYCTGIDRETITWADYAWNNGSAAIDVEGLEDGVYVFYLEQDGSGKLSVNTSETRPYTGLYYIRTNCLDGGWNSYKSSSDNQMTYAPYPETRYGFNYYKTQWVGTTGTDVTYTIACDFSPALCDTLVADEGNNPLSASQARSLPHAANIRFGWHSKTNKMTRAYINGSTNVSDRFLVMIGDTKLKDKDGNALAISGLNANEISFTDLNNWIYRCDVTAVEGAAVKLTANYDGHVQYFIGTSETPEEILGGTGSKEYLMRVTYDFKTNRLMTAWLPSGSRITDDVELKADMMLIREGQNAATQVYFNGNNHKITEVKTIFGVMEFQYDHIAGQFPSWSSPNAYKYLMYYISFPFDVKISEIFGAGVRGENWIIQKYNGAKRAQIGWFAETSTFWETMDGSETMNAYEGYLLLLDRVTFNDPSSSIWYKQSSGNSVYLYFPSSSNSIGTIDDEDKLVTVPAHTCTINRDFTVDGVAGTLNHRNTDSHWNILGTPLFETHTASSIGDPVADGAGGTTLKYFYSWNFNNNTLRPQAVLSTDTTFKSMHSYMVQYAGDVIFHGAAIKPASVAARRIPSSKNYQIELQMVNGTGEASYTYVELRENAKDTFELNEDMYMVRSSKMADLYTFAGAYDVAANVLTVNNHIVPVGMDVKQAGTYRFTMPSEFSGTVTLVDTQTGARTNLALGDYEVNLAKGTLNNRFQLEINIQSSTTSLEGNDVKDGGAHKFIENGVMYILRDGKVFNAQGSRVK